jgi:prefoldin subunit 5
MKQWTDEVTACLQGYENQAQEIGDGIEELQAAISKIKRS